MKRHFILICFGLLLTLSGAAPAQAAFFGLFGDSGVEEARAQDGQVTLDVSKLAGAEARHYRYTEGGVSIRFFLARDKMGSVRAALDACEVCWREGKGYVLKNGAMLCRNCGRVFALERVGLSAGGCNPHPLEFRLDGASVRIETQELLAGAKYFPGNK